MRIVRPLTSVLLTAALMAFGAPAPAWGGTEAPGSPADVYSYLENPEMVGELQEPPHADLLPYRNLADAQADRRQAAWTRSLDGDWRLRVVNRPEELPAGFHADGYDTSAWPRVSVPHTWQTDGLDHPIFRNIPSEIYPDDPPRVPHDVNPTGAYVKTFDMPAPWLARRTFLRFDGVSSGYFIWVNGKYAGYDQGGYTAAEFDITPHLRRGTNTLAVQVHRWGSGAHLEDWDQWRFSGIFRSVRLHSTPQTYLHDIGITTDLDAQYRDATLTTSVEVTRKGGATGAYRVNATLLDPQGRAAAEFSGQVDVGEKGGTARLQAPVPNPAKWSDEAPNLYRLVVSLIDPAGQTTHITNQPVGFREIEIKDRTLRVNGERILIKGTNRAETDPSTGRYQSRARMEQDVRLMKRLNINAVRTSHYPSDPYLYDLADRRGLWINDEVDIETHHHDWCPEDCLAVKPEWQKAFLDRFVSMIERDKNHPSVFLWSTGNEAGLGTAHHTMAAWARANDPSRPLIHQPNSPDGDAPFADVWGPRYGQPFTSSGGRVGLEQAAKTTKKPIIMGEYEHAMGNSLGHFKEFWDVIRRNAPAQGGFVWDWAEQQISQPLRTTPDGSGNGILSWLTGIPAQVAGHDGKGKALQLSGLDDYVEVYRDPKLDALSNALTVDAWVKPGPWVGDFTVVAKGDRQYALKMANQNTLEFFVYGGGTWRSVRAPVPTNWYGNWHRVSGSYDGATVRLFIDGVQAAQLAWAGTIDTSRPYPVNVGRNAETGQENRGTRTSAGVIDNVRIYHTALTPEKLATDPFRDAVLALDFDQVTDTGRTYFSYGVGMGGVDGIVHPDRTLQPEAYELAAVHAPILFSEPTPGSARAGRLTVTNEKRFTGTDGVELRWRVQEASRTIATGTQPLRIGPGATTGIQLPPSAASNDIERWLTVEAREGAQLVGQAQFAVGGALVRGVHSAARPGALRTADTSDTVVVEGTDFRYTFDKAKGTLSSMRVRGTELLHAGPQLDAWRAPINNEFQSEDRQWRSAGLDRLVTEVENVTVDPARDSVVVTVRSTAAGAPGGSFAQTMAYSVSGNGEVRILHRAEPLGSVRNLQYLPRLGFELRVPSRFDTFSWYGRGPHENYPDRKSGAPVGLYRSTVDKQFVPYHQPQDYGNHDDVRWATLSDGSTGGLLVGGDLNVGVTPYDELDRAAYPFALKRNAGWNTLHVDHAVSGVSETFHAPLPPYRVAASRAHTYSVVLRPLGADEVGSGIPRGPAVCAPKASLTAPQPQAGSVTARLQVSNPCRTPLTALSARMYLPTGWTASPATMAIGDLLPGQTRTVDVTISGITPGRNVVTANVTAASAGVIESVAADLDLNVGGSLASFFSNAGIGDDGKGNADFDGGGWYYSRENLQAKGVVAGKRLTVPGLDLTYELPTTPAGRPDNLVADGQVVDLSGVPASATKLSFVGAASGGDAEGGQATLTYADGTTTQISFELGDWCLGGDPSAPPKFGNIGIVQGDYRNRGTAKDPVKCWLFATAPVALQTGKRLASVTMPTIDNAHVFAIADNGPRTR
jgi:beta-galactosidase